MTRSVAAPALALLLALSQAPRARGQDCAPPDLEHSVPAEGAAGVPTDAVFRARYAPSAEHRGEVVVLQRDGEPEASIDAEWQPSERTLLALPDDGVLVPGARYTLRWPPLRSIDGDTLGVGGTVRFETGVGPDLGPPSFGGVEELSWDARKVHDDCVGSAEERYHFDFRVAGGSDDTGPGTLQALVFQSAGPTLSEEDPPPVVAVEPMPAAGEQLRVRLPREQSLGEVCFVVVARDLAGNLSPGGGESCVVTERPPFFGGCAAGGRPTPIGWASLVALGAALLGRMRRRR